MTFIVALANGRTIKHTTKDGCKDADVVVYRVKKMGWNAISAVALKD